MKSNIALTLVGISFLLSACLQKNKNPDKMNAENHNSIFPKGAPLSNDWFTGSASIFRMVSKDENNEFSAGAVTFTVGARTNWHTHPKGQVLIVTEGKGLYQERGKPARIIQQGDVVKIDKDVEHWHGATNYSQMVHIAITNFKGEKQVDWLKAVSEEEFAKANGH